MSDVYNSNVAKKFSPEYPGVAKFDEKEDLVIKTDIVPVVTTEIRAAALEVAIHSLPQGTSMLDILKASKTVEAYLLDGSLPAD